MQFLLRNPYFNAIRNVNKVLDKDQKQRSWVMIALLIVNALFDFLGLATVGALIVSSLESDALSAQVYALSDANSSAEYEIHLILRMLYKLSGAQTEFQFLFYLSIVIFFMFLIKNAISLVITYIQNRYAFNIALRLSQKMFRHYYDQGYLFIQDSSSGKRMYAIVEIPARFAGYYLNQLLDFTTELLVLLIIGVALFFIEPAAVLLLASVIIPVFIIIYLFVKTRIRDMGKARNELVPIIYSKVFEAMKAYVDVKLSNSENRMLRVFTKAQRSLNDLDALYQGVYLKINQKTNDIIFGLGILLIFGWAYFSNSEKESVLMLLGLFGIAAYKFLPSVNRMMGQLLNLKSFAYVIDELKEVSSLTYRPFEDVTVLPFSSTIEMKNISFNYPNNKKNVLNNFNLKVNKGETIGFIGTSGSGKTTLLKLFLRLIREHKGEVLVDGQILTEENDARFQRLIGYVEQDVFILNDTLKANIAFGEDEIDLLKLNRAISESQLIQFVNEQTDGLDMQLGEGGVKLSGGQKQRVGIARALYKDSEVLVFDEITSALDSETERAVVESINALCDLGKTIIIVAHRVTTLERCTKIYRMEKGRIKEEVMYADLVKEVMR